MNADDVLRLAREAGLSIPTPSEKDGPVRIWYMRDNHTFRELPLEEEQAIAAIAEDFADGYRCGMLCSHQVEVTLHHDYSKANSVFFDAARPLIRKAIEESKKRSSTDPLQRFADLVGDERAKDMRKRAVNLCNERAAICAELGLRSDLQRRDGWLGAAAAIAELPLSQPARGEGE